VASSYWERHPDGPFVTLIAVAATYLNPESYDLECLKELAKREDDEEMRVFKRELRQALQDPSQLPGDELSESVEYDDGSDKAFLRRLWHDLYGNEPLEAPRGLFDPDLEFRELGTDELVAMVSRPGESVLRGGRTLMELGRRASSDTALLHQVADMVRDPENRRFIAMGTVSLSQLGMAGLVAGGGEPAAALAQELAGEWAAGKRSDFAWLMKSSGIAWWAAALAAPSLTLCV
jgi:hypothetical protein